MLDILFSKLARHFGNQYFSNQMLVSGTSKLGRFVGKQVEKYLFPGNVIERYVAHNLITDFSLNHAQYGDDIPLIFGKAKLPGKIIWTSEMDFTQYNFTETKEASSGAIRKVHHTELAYKLHLAMAISEGIVDKIFRVWHNNTLIDISKYQYRFYRGTETQKPDSIIAKYTKDKTPAYKGLSYIVFENLPLKDFNNTIPNFVFEVSRQPVLSSSDLVNSNLVEHMIKAIALSPGVGEYLYDTKIQTHQLTNHPELGQYDHNIFPINQNSYSKISDSAFALDNMLSTCPNLKWVSVSPSWFVISVNAEDTFVKPGVQYKDSSIKYSEPWKVATYNRNNAYLTQSNPQGRNQYPGTPTDNSIVNYLKALKKRTLKIMFAPNLKIDLPNDPRRSAWIGHLKAQPHKIKEFFHKQYGYNQFILHYAALVKDYVDVFIIGTELVGITSAHENKNFNGVDELISLARQVKNILGSHVKVSYSAYASEYTHTEHYYNMDKLWMSKAIDFIGINAYFPISDTLFSEYVTNESLKKGSKLAEEAIYRRSDQGKKIRLKSTDAIKKIEYWWSNKHKNKDKSFSVWVPESKKIWFTEFGFPSVDKGGNLKSRDHDPRVTTNQKQLKILPQYSTGTADNDIQRRAIKNFILFWQNTSFVENMFLWSWDISPFDTFPKDPARQQNKNDWKIGLMVNDKFNVTHLSSIIAEISGKCGISKRSLIFGDELHQVIEGFPITNQTIAKNIIDLLANIYFFDILTNENDSIHFVPRYAFEKLNHINDDMLIQLTDDSTVKLLDLTNITVPAKIDVYFLSADNDYQLEYVHVNNDEISTAQNESLQLPIIMTEDDAANIGHKIISALRSANTVMEFAIDAQLVQLYVGDIIYISYMHKNYMLRIIKIHTDFTKNKSTILGVTDNSANYRNHR